MTDSKYYYLQEFVVDSFLIDSPIEIESGKLLLEKSTGEITLLLKLNVLIERQSDISSVTINVSCLDDAGEKIPKINPYKFVFRDIFLIDKKSFGEKTPIALDNRVRRVQVNIERVVFIDSKIWHSIGENIKQPKLEEVNSLSLDLLGQLERDKNLLSNEEISNIVYLPRQLNNFWVCTCGRPNDNSAEECCRCGFTRDKLFKIINEKSLFANLEIFNELQMINAEKARLEQELVEKDKQEKIQRDEEDQIRRLEEKKRRSIKNRKSGIVFGSLVLLIGILYFVGLPAINYSIATKYLESKNYDYAIYMFSALGNYRDSDQMVNEVNFQKAADYLAKKQFDESIMIFQTLGDYKSADDFKKEAKYQKAKSFLLQRELDQAISILLDLGNYQNSIAMLIESRYQKALDLLANSKYEDSINILIELNDYKNSNAMILNEKYLWGKELFEQNKYKDAIALFSSIGDYKDTSEILKEAKYRLANQLLSEIKYEDAIKIFDELNDYKDSSKLSSQSKAGLKEANYQNAKDSFFNGKFEESNQLFSDLNYYKDTNYYIGKLKPLLGIQGTWEIVGRSDIQLVIDGWRVYFIYSSSLQAEEQPRIQEKNVSNFSIYFISYRVDGLYDYYSTFYLPSNTIRDTNIKITGWVPPKAVPPIKSVYRKISDSTSNPKIPH
jgi:TolA-binding protein